MSAIGLSQLVVDTSLTIDEVSAFVAGALGVDPRPDQSGRVVGELSDGLRVVVTTGPGHRQPVSVPVDGLPAMATALIDFDVDHSVAAKQLHADLTALALPFTNEEMRSLRASMPQLQQIVTPLPPDWQPALTNWAVVWRDHFVEDTLLSLDALVSLGVDPRYILALDKGDGTAKPARIAATLQQLGASVGLFDNNYDNDAESALSYARAADQVSDFARRAHASGRKVMVVDDGLIVLGCFPDGQDEIDAVVELTRSGLKRLQKLQALTVPLYDLARSDLKQRITYREIAESCVRRIQELSSESTFSGRSVVVVGYGALGRLVAGRFREQGALVSVVDTSGLALVEAGHAGFTTFTDPTSAVMSAAPRLLVGCAGEPWFSWEIAEQLPDRAIVSAVATADLSCLRDPPQTWSRLARQNVGAQWISPRGRYFFQLGEGRSINLYRSEAVPNAAIDLFKSAITVAMVDLARRVEEGTAQPGIHTTEVNAAMNDSPLYPNERALGR